MRALFALTQLCCYESKDLHLVREYTELALKGEMAKALEVNLRMEPIRKAFGGMVLEQQLIPGKLMAQIKYWAECLGMVGGPVRPPLPQLTEEEKRKIRGTIESAFRAAKGKAT